MRRSEFDYDLPNSLIAQAPAPERDQSRLMVLHRQGRRIEHRAFRDIVGYLQKGDVLVLNDSKVIPARLVGASPRRGDRNARGEVLLLEETAANLWECLVKPARKFRPGSRVFFGDHDLVAEVVADTPFQSKVVRFRCETDVRELLPRIGAVPLPPYIKRKKSLPMDRERYQTVFATKDGSVAAPTAGLHFTDRVLGEIRSNGIEVRFVTLHVGLGTFQPVKVHEIEQHRMHSEWFSISRVTAQAVNHARRSGRRIVAVGTTTARVLEAAAEEDGTIHARSGKTDLFIYPGYKFKVLGDGALLTNFHLPRSTLLMLVCAFAGRDFALGAYREAIRREYRFYSYGDAMLIL
jgi:S-adenosylmethionine:tRNA ribosyltransferase-isomerase